MIAPSRRLAMLATMAVAMTGAAALYPLAPDAQEDIAGARHLAPLTRAHAIELHGERVWILTRLQRTAAGWVGYRAGAAVSVLREQAVAEPRLRLYALGTDALGRDLASRLLHGARSSMAVAGVSVLVALVLGVFVGLVAAGGGRRIDALLMRTVDVFLAVPRLLLFLLLATLLPPSPATLILVLGGLTWPGLARLVRAETLRIRATEFSRAAEATGGSPARIAVRHLLPQLRSLIAVTLTLRFADTIVLEAGLSFLGLGLPVGSPSLGGIIAGGRFAFREAWWVVVLPVALLTAMVLVLRTALADEGRGDDAPSIL